MSTTPDRELTKQSRAFARDLARRFNLRVHASLIILFAWSCGFASTKLLYVSGVESMVARYAIALVVLYAAFLVGVRLWIWYALNAAPGRKRDDSKKSSFNSGGDFSFGGGGGGGGRSSSGGSSWGGGGGRSGGGGASSSFEGPSTTAPAFVAPAADVSPIPASTPSIAASTSGSGRSSSSSGGSWWSGGKSSSGSGGGSGDSDGIGALIIGLFFVALVIAVCAAVGYVIYIGPEMLADAAFQFLLAGGLLKHAHEDHPNWIRGIIKATWIPFTVIFVIMLGFATAASFFYPEAHTMYEVWQAW